MSSLVGNQDDLEKAINKNENESIKRIKLLIIEKIVDAVLTQ